MSEFFLGIGIMLGVVVAPFMTVGYIMHSFGHETLGIVLFILGCIHMLIKWLFGE